MSLNDNITSTQFQLSAELRHALLGVKEVSEREEISSSIAIVLGSVCCLPPMHSLFFPFLLVFFF